MPVILRPPDEARWLSQKLNLEEIESILVPIDADQMIAHPVSRLITAKHIDSNVPDAIMPKVYPELPSLS